MHFRADLHCHSTCSDGSLTPKELLDLAKASDLRGLSITDHDSFKAYAEALPYAEEIGLKLFSGAEFSSTGKLGSAHILAYAFDLNSKSLEAFCERHMIRRNERNGEILRLLEKKGMPVSAEEVRVAAGPFKEVIIGRPHIAKAMVEKGYVPHISAAFHRYLGDGKPCYAPGDVITAEETIDQIHKAGGKAVIAHPHLIRNPGLLAALLRMDFDGIEGHYAGFAPHIQQQFVKLGVDRGWMVTGGSDFHGDPKPHIPLGRSWVGEETFNLLYEHFLAHELPAAD